MVLLYHESLMVSIQPVTYQIYNSQSVTPIGSPVSDIIPASGSLVVTNFGCFHLVIILF
jgi:hypothetical protein